MSSEKFCLRWNDFESNISVAFRELREDKDFFDVTLACDDDQIQAHKVILSACSPFFRNVLRKNPHQHPLLYLKNVRFTDLQSVLNFMYHGEVNVAQEELNSFLAVAEDLRVKGLTQSSSGQSQSKRENKENNGTQINANPTQSVSKRSSFQPDRDSSVKRSKPNEPFYQEPVDEDIQEIAPVVKSEPGDQYHAPVVQQEITPPVPRYTPAPAAQQEVVEAPAEIPLTQDQALTSYQEEAEYEDYGQYEAGYDEIVEEGAQNNKGMNNCISSSGHTFLTNRFY